MSSTIEQRLEDILNKYGLYHDKMSDELSDHTAQELDQALTKISFYHAIPKKELEKTIKENN